MIFTSEVLAAFQGQLQERLAREGKLTEDSVRYSLYASLQQSRGIANSEIQIEYEHPRIKGARIDSFLPASPEHPAAAWELKYDRTIPSGKNQPRSNKAGALVNDFLRLAAFDETECFERVVIYLTDSEMATYFRNPKNGFAPLFDLAPGQSFRIDGCFVGARARSVKNKVRAPISTCFAVAKLAASLHRDHHLRLYEVHLPTGS